MEYVKRGQQILKKATIDTATQRAEMLTYVGLSCKITATSQGSTIRLQWQEFNLGTGQYESASLSDSFRVVVESHEFEFPATDGRAEFTLDAQAGRYLIRTVNDGVDNTEITVVIPDES